MLWRRRMRIVGLVALIAACGRQAFVGFSGPGNIATATPTVPSTPTPTPVLDIADWAFHSEITVSGAGLTGPLSGFPVPVVIDKGVVTGAQAGGADLRFFDATLNPIPYEIEVWNTGAQSVAWVLSPQIEKGTGASFEMYWGNPAVTDAQTPPLVWSSAGFSAVWHLSTSLTASTGPANDINVTEAPDAPGLFGRGRSFNGTDAQYLSSPDNPSLDPTAALTISAWVFPLNWTANNRIVEKGAGDDQYKFNREEQGFIFTSSPITLTLDKLGEADSGGTFNNTGAWIHLACTYDGQHITVYVNGKQAGQSGQTGKIPTSTDPFFIGGKEGSTTNSDYFDGTIDEVRFSPVARSADWILAEYEAGAGTLVKVGAAE